MGDSSELPSSTMGLVDVPTFDDFLPDIAAEDPYSDVFSDEDSLMTVEGADPAQHGQARVDSATQGQFDPFDPHNNIPIDPSFIGQMPGDYTFTNEELEQLFGTGSQSVQLGEPATSIQHPQPVYPSPMNTLSEDALTNPYSIESLNINSTWTGPKGFEPQTQNQFANITPAGNLADQSFLLHGAPKSCSMQHLAPREYVPFESQNADPDARALSPAPPRKPLRLEPTYKQLKAPIKAFCEELAAAQQGGAQQGDSQPDTGRRAKPKPKPKPDPTAHELFNAFYDSFDAPDSPLNAPEAHMYPSTASLPPPNTISLPHRGHQRNGTRSTLDKLRNDRHAFASTTYPRPNSSFHPTGSSSTPNPPLDPKTMHLTHSRTATINPSARIHPPPPRPLSPTPENPNPNIPELSILSSAAASNYALWAPVGDNAPLVQARRKKHPGRKLQVTQTPGVIERNYQRRMRYRDKLTPEQRKKYDEEHPGMVNVLDAETR